MHGRPIAWFRSVVKRCALLLLFASCARPPDEHAQKAAQPFVGAEAVLVDLVFSSTLAVDTADEAERSKLVDTQLLYLVGQLNGERSVGWHHRAEITITSSSAKAVSYRVKMPVAWGAAEMHAEYTVRLPARAGVEDQRAFADKYAGTCTDPEGGIRGSTDAGRMFLFFRPQRSSCVLAPDDVVTSVAALSPAAENSVGKYPEYHRVWEDRALNVVAVFGVEGKGEPDAGRQAYDDFVRALRGTMSAGERSADRVRLTRSLPRGRTVRVDAAVVGPDLATEPTSFDDWYDARTLDADMIIYSGHAGLGANVRALSQKGSFRRGHYVVMVINGCDTLAYLDGTLAERRRTDNPDDPAGTKHMDTVTNVLGGYFHSGDETSLTLLNAFVSALDAPPKTYAQLLGEIDPTQISVVTGEEDNVFEPAMLTELTEVERSDQVRPLEPRPVEAKDVSLSGHAACAMPNGPISNGASAIVILLAAVTLRRRYARPTTSASGRPVRWARRSWA
jgi:hypothetical protein